MRRDQNLSEKKLHKALRSVQFVASFTSFYFEILSYLACGEKIIRLASKNSVKSHSNNNNNHHNHNHNHNHDNDMIIIVHIHLSWRF